MCVCVCVIYIYTYTYLETDQAQLASPAGPSSTKGHSPRSPQKPSSHAHAMLPALAQGGPGVGRGAFRSFGGGCGRGRGRGRGGRLLRWRGRGRGLLGRRGPWKVLPCACVCINVDVHLKREMCGCVFISYIINTLKTVKHGLFDLGIHHQQPVSYTHLTLPTKA